MTWHVTFDLSVVECICFEMQGSCCINNHIQLDLPWGRTSSPCVCLCVCLSVCVCLCLCICVWVWLFVYLGESVNLFVCGWVKDLSSTGSHTHTHCWWALVIIYRTLTNTNNLRQTHRQTDNDRETHLMTLGPTHTHTLTDWGGGGGGSG